MRDHETNVVFGHQGKAYFFHPGRMPYFHYKLIFLIFISKEAVKMIGNLIVETHHGGELY